MIYKVDIPSIKANIGEKIGQKIIVKGSLGRSKSFEKEATIEKYGEQAKDEPIKHIHLVDAELAYLDYSILDSINLLSPYGQAWEEPLFSTIFRVKKAKKISRPRNNDMYIMQLIDNKGTIFETVYYTKDGDDIELRDNMELNII